MAEVSDRSGRDPSVHHQPTLSTCELIRRKLEQHFYGDAQNYYFSYYSDSQGIHNYLRAIEPHVVENDLRRYYAVTVL